jgi:hypothetical protein
VEDGWLVVCGALVLVLLLNLGIIMAFVGREGRQQAARWGRAIRNLTNPWHEEDEAFAELNRLVRDLNAEKREDLHDES